VGVKFRKILQDRKKMVRLVMGQDKDQPRLRAQIDQNLKRVYEEALDAEVPDRFKELLAKLREKEAKT
jgi:hypothetical protein